MRIVDDELLQVFRMATRCEWCRKATPQGCDPAHLWARGMGSGGRLDIRENLISLCRQCHTESHAGFPSRIELLAIVAQREGCFQSDIETAVYALRNMDKSGDPAPVLRKLRRTT